MRGLLLILMLACAAPLAAQGLTDAELTRLARSDIASAVGRREAQIAFKDLRVRRRYGYSPSVCGTAAGKRFVFQNEGRSYLVLEGKSDPSTFVNQWNRYCARSDKEMAADPEGVLAEFRDAIAAKKADIAAAVMLSSRDAKLDARMRGYAQEHCISGDQTACLVAHCQGGLLPRENMTPKCAGLMGLAHGEGWVESRRSQRGAFTEYSILCLKGKDHHAAWCQSRDQWCRRGLAPRDLAAAAGRLFPDLDAAARNACRLY